MKLFIDTTNKIIILGLINKTNNVVSFKKITSNQNVVENGLEWIINFLKKENLSLNEIKKYYLSIGPGSYTGTKFGLNLVKTINLVEPIEELFIINTFKLINNNKKYSIITAGKSKWYIKNNNFPFSKPKAIKSLTNFDKSSYSLDHLDFDEKLLEKKVIQNKFKKVKNIDNLKSLYV